MNYRLLGKTGLKVSELAFGSVEIGMPYGIGVREQKDMIAESDAILLLQEALDKGINFFDTARMYGRSEEIIGKAFSGKRKDVIIASKCVHLRDETGKLPAGTELEPKILKSLHTSLQNLRTDYLDEFMILSADEELISHPDVIRIFNDLREKGVIRATGVSTYTTAETKRVMDESCWDIIQLPFNLLDQRQKLLFSEAGGRGIGIVVRSVLMKGLLSDRGKHLHEALHKVEAHVSRYETLLSASACDLPALAIRFALSFPEVSSVLLGIDRREYLRQSLKAASSVLNPAIKTAAEKLAFPEPEFLNLHQWSQNGWLI
jgi:aryl-alcohol dehydrogenase-like predicted oxidoreductase